MGTCIVFSIDLLYFLKSLSEYFLFFYLSYTRLAEPVLLDETCLTREGALVSHALFECFLQYIIWCTFFLSIDVEQAVGMPSMLQALRERRCA